VVRYLSQLDEEKLKELVEKGLNVYLVDGAESTYLTNYRTHQAIQYKNFKIPVNYFVFDHHKDCCIDNEGKVSVADTSGDCTIPTIPLGRDELPPSIVSYAHHLFEIVSSWLAAGDLEVLPKLFQRPHLIAVESKSALDHDNMTQYLLYRFIRDQCNVLTQVANNSPEKVDTYVQSVKNKMAIIGEISVVLGWQDMFQGSTHGTIDKTSELHKLLITLRDTLCPLISLTTVRGADRRLQNMSIKQRLEKDYTIFSNAVDAIAEIFPNFVIDSSAADWLRADPMDYRAYTSQKKSYSLTKDSYLVKVYNILSEVDCPVDLIPELWQVFPKITQSCSIHNVATCKGMLLSWIRLKVSDASEGDYQRKVTLFRKNGLKYDQLTKKEKTLLDYTINRVTVKYWPYGDQTPEDLLDHVGNGIFIQNKGAGTSNETGYTSTLTMKYVGDGERPVYAPLIENIQYVLSCAASAHKNLPRAFQHFAGNLEGSGTRDAGVSAEFVTLVPTILEIIEEVSQTVDITKISGYELWNRVVANLKQNAYAIPSSEAESKKANYLKGVIRSLFWNPKHKRIQSLYSWLKLMEYGRVETLFDNVADDDSDDESTEFLQELSRLMNIKELVEVV
jgi:hypothetical protein